MGVLSFSDGLFKFHGTFHERIKPKQAGFYWNSETKLWQTEDIRKAQHLMECSDSKAQQVFNKYLFPHKAFAPVEPSQEVNGFKYMPFQIEGIKFASQRPHSLIADEMGLGKSAQALGVIRNSAFKKVLIVCPPYLVMKWLDEISKWVPEIKLHEIDIVTKQIDFVEPEALIYIVSDSVLIHNVEELSKFKFDFMIVDEAHRFRTPTAQRTIGIFGLKHKMPSKCFTGLIERSKRVIYLTGTPMPNRPIELYGMLSKSCPVIIDFKNRHDYAVEFCGARIVPIYRNGEIVDEKWDYNGASSLDRLNERLRHFFMIRRLKKDVLKDLPPKNETILLISPEDDVRKFLDDELKYENAVIKDSSIAEYGAETIGDLAKIRKEIAKFKIEPAIEIILDVMREKNKMMILGYHREFLIHLSRNKKLKEFLPLLINGDSPTRYRQEVIDTFRKSEVKRILIANYITVGGGFDIVENDEVLFLESPWSPDLKDQAIDRSHRIGQTNSVNVRHLVFKNSLDEKVLKTMMRKEKIIQQAIN